MTHENIVNKRTAHAHGTEP